jgi:putative endopeptidase
MTSTTMRALTAAALLSASFGLASSETNKPQIGKWGFDLTGMDRSVKPGDDFFRFGGGTWLKNTPIPADRSSWGSFIILRANAETDVKAIVEEVASHQNAPGSIEQKVADYYASYLDTNAIEKAGLEPVKADLAAIAGAQSYEDVVKLMARADIDVGGPVGVSIGLDQKNPDHYSVDINQAGLGLPDRDYYLKDDAKFVETRAKYRTYIEKMLGLASYPDASQSADAIVALETEIAKLHWPREKRRNRDLTYNPKSQAELKAFAPDFPWGDALATAEIPNQDFFIVRELDAVQALTKLFRETPVETWRAYMTFHYLNSMSDVLPVAFDDLAFDFNGRTLSGQPEKRERWKRATTALNGALGEAVGEVYVRRHFTAQAKAQMAALVENLRAAYRARIAKLTWMSDETKEAAFRKLARFRVKIGYPDTWRDYSTLEIRAGDAVGNRKRATVWEWHREAVRLDKPTDRGEWGMTPQTVNAYYNSVFNEIVFPAAILQPPFFDPNADPAVNYGAIGGVIGHEMGHGFDDQGSKSDENGVLHTWWKDEDIARFKVLVANLSKQYGGYEPLPGLHLNGDLTLGENIGDNGGLSVAHEAYLISLKGKKPKTIDGFTAEQRFFLAWAQIYRANIRDEQLRVQVTSDPHSPSEFRVNGVVRNMDAWYDAFGVKPGDKLYLDPKDRVHIW